MELIDIVRKLIGPIDPVGDSVVDEQRFENLLVLTDFADAIICDIERVWRENKDSHQHSRKKAGIHCDKVLAAFGVHVDD